MASKSDQRRKKRLQKQKKKRAAAQRERGSRPGQGGMPSKVRLDQALTWPVDECYVSESWHEQGARVQVIATRRSNTGRLAIASYEVDLAEQGIVQCALVGGLTDIDLQAQLTRASAEGVAMALREPELIAKIVTVGHAWGVSQGHEPPAAADRGLRFLTGIDPDAAPEEIRTGITPPEPEKKGIFSGIGKLFGRG